MLHILFLILALLCFIAATARILEPRVNLVALGLMFWMLDLVIRAGG